MTASAQPRQKMSEIVNSRTLSLRGIQSNGIPFGEAGIIAKNGVHKPSEGRSGTDFHERADSGMSHVADFLNELHRLRKLPGEQGTHLVRVFRVAMSSGVGENRGGRLREDDRIEDFAEGSLCVTDQGTMKCRGHGEAGLSHLSLLQNRDRLFDHSSRTGQHRLIRGILVGNHQIEFGFLQHLLNVLKRSMYREHRPSIAIAQRGHEMPAKPRKMMQRSRIEHSRRTESGEFAIAMSCISIGLQAKGFQNLQGTERDSADGRLRDLGLAKSSLLFGSRFDIENGVRIDEITEAFFGFAPGQTSEDAIGLVQDFLHDRKLTGEIAEHSHILRSLTGEQNSHGSGCGTMSVVNSIR